MKRQTEIPIIIMPSNIITKNFNNKLKLKKVNCYGEDILLVFLKEKPILFELSLFGYKITIHKKLFSYGIVKK